jgi:hypothetical protein
MPVVAEGRNPTQQRLDEDDSEDAPADASWIENEPDDAA